MTDREGISGPKKALIIGGAALIAILIASVFGVPHKIQAWYSTTTVAGEVQGYLLNPEARVAGLILKDGKQIEIEAGNALAEAIKPGDKIQAEGEAGKSTSYGQHLRAFTVKNVATGASVIAVAPKPPHEGPHHPPHGQRPGEPPHPIGPNDRPAPPPPPAPVDPATTPPAVDPVVDPAATTPPPPVAPMNRAESMTASGTIATMLVSGRGDVTGCILSSGEQLHFSPRTAESLLSNGGAIGTTLKAAGRGVKTDAGVFIEVNELTVGEKAPAVK